MRKREVHRTFHIIDIETIPNDDAIKSEAWYHKKKKNEKLTDHDAGLDPIFGQIVAISDCFVNFYTDYTCLSLSSSMVMGHAIDDEATDMKNFCDYINDLDQDNLFVAHNGKGFDYHFLAKRILAHKLRLPRSLELAGLKPWNVKHVDTMELMQMGSNKYHSLEDLCYLFDEPTPKDAMDGSEVWNYFKVGRTNEIVKYCSKDVTALANVFMKMIKQGVYDPCK